jgi:hypothetical protein
MALETWGERLGLLALGYRLLLWIHVHCTEHGLWRTAIAEELETYACPVCAAACKCVILAASYTRRPLPCPPELIVAPLSARTRLRSTLWGWRDGILSVDAIVEFKLHETLRAPEKALSRHLHRCKAQWILGSVLRAPNI